MFVLAKKDLFGSVPDVTECIHTRLLIEFENEKLWFEGSNSYVGK